MTHRLLNCRTTHQCQRLKLLDIAVTLNNTKQHTPTYILISFHSVTKSDLLVAPCNQLQYSCHAASCSHWGLS